MRHGWKPDRFDSQRPPLVHPLETKPAVLPAACQRLRRHLVVFREASCNARCGSRCRKRRCGHALKSATDHPVALVLLMAFQADFGSFGFFQFFKIQDQPRLLAARNHVPTGRAMTVFASLFAMNVVCKRGDIGLMTSHAQLVVVYIFRLGIGDGWISDFQHRKAGLLIGGQVCPRPKGHPFGMSYFQSDVSKMPTAKPSGPGTTSFPVEHHPPICHCFRLTTYLHVAVSNSLKSAACDSCFK